MYIQITIQNKYDQGMNRPGWYGSSVNKIIIGNDRYCVEYVSSIWKVGEEAKIGCASHCLFQNHIIDLELWYLLLIIMFFSVMRFCVLPLLNKASLNYHVGEMYL